MTNSSRKGRKKKNYMTTEILLELQSLKKSKSSIKNLLKKSKEFHKHIMIAMAIKRSLGAI